MADNVYPPGFAELVEKLRKVMLKQNTPRPATSSPWLDAAVNEVAKKYPLEVAQSDIKDMPWSNDYAGTNVLGTTDINKNLPQNVQINPALSMLFPQKATEGTLRHELQHVRQHLDYKPYLPAWYQKYDPPPQIDIEDDADKAKQEWLKYRMAVDSDLDMLPQANPYWLPKSPKVKD